MTLQKISIWHNAEEKKPPLTGKSIPIRYNGILYTATYYGAYAGEKNDCFWTSNAGWFNRSDFKDIEWEEQTVGIVLTEERYNELMLEEETLKEILNEAT